MIAGILTAFVQGFLLGGSISALPGPFQIYVLSHTLNYGVQRTLPAIFVPLVSDGPIIVLVLVVLINMPTWLLSLLSLVGGVVVLILAHSAYRAFRTAEDAPSDPIEPASHNVFSVALLINLLNPNPYIFWGTVGGTLILNQWQQSGGMAAGFLIGFYSGFVLLLFGLMIMVTTARHAIPSVSRVLRGGAALALLGFGLYQLWVGIQGLYDAYRLL